MKKIYTSLFVFFAVGIISASAQTNSVVLIPPTGPSTNYSSITAAYAAIPSPPTGNYIIEITSAYNGSTETFPITLGDKGLSSGGPTITIRPAAGVNGKVIQRTTAAAGPTIYVNGGDNIIIDGRPAGVTSVATDYLTVNDTYSGDNTSRDIEFSNGANNNIVRYVNAVAAPATASAGSRVIAITSSPSGQSNNNNTITNNIITGGLRGVQVFGSVDANTGNVISNNTIKDFGSVGVLAGSFQDNTTIQANTITFSTFSPLGTQIIGIQLSGTPTTTNVLNNNVSLPLNSATAVTAVWGIYSATNGTVNITANNINNLFAPNATVVNGTTITAGTAAVTINYSKNKISDLSSNAAANIRGIELFPFAGSVLNINNNFVAITQTNSTANAILGILLGNTSGTAYTTNLYFNSVRIGGTHTGGTVGSIVSAGIYKSDNNAGSTLNMKNNISVNERTGGTNGVIHVGFFMSNTTGTNNLDYNTYYATDPNGGYAAGWVSNVYAPDASGLAAYKAAASPNEQNSNFTSVTFVSNTDLHLAPPSDRDPALKGILIGGITTDIDNQARSAEPRRGADDNSLPYPVTIIAFNGENKGGYNLLTWSTATEINNKGFELQRSLNGVEFTPLAFINSKSTDGNSYDKLSYSFDDKKPFSNNSYYRLKQIDKDGKVTYSATVLIKGRGITKLEISNLYPNPVVNELRFVIASTANAKLVATVVDINGKSILQQPVTVKEGDNILSMNVATLGSGTFILSVRNIETGEMITARFVK